MVTSFLTLVLGLVHLPYFLGLFLFKFKPKFQAYFLLILIWINSNPSFSLWYLPSISKWISMTSFSPLQSPKPFLLLLLLLYFFFIHFFFLLFLIPMVASHTHTPFSLSIIHLYHPHWHHSPMIPHLFFFFSLSLFLSFAHSSLSLSFSPILSLTTTIAFPYWHDPLLVATIPPTRCPHSNWHLSLSLPSPFPLFLFFLLLFLFSFLSFFILPTIPIFSLISHVTKTHTPIVVTTLQTISSSCITPCHHSSPISITIGRKPHHRMDYHHLHAHCCFITIFHLRHGSKLQYWSLTRRVLRYICCHISA